MRKIIINGEDLTIDEVAKVAKEYYIVEIDECVKEKIINAEEMVHQILEDKKVSYGINTGFGKFSDTVISNKDVEIMQRNLIVSHACGVGDALSEDIVRSMMLLRINSLIKGHSGIRLSTIKSLLKMLNNRVFPVIYEKGSLGASGDLCPLSHLALVLIGEGEAFYDGEIIKGSLALNKAGLTPVVLQAKEGLALINGTQFMSAIGCKLVYEGRKLLRSANLTLSLSMEALEGIIDAFNLKIHKIRPHVGQVYCANEVLENLKGSLRVTNQGDKRVQDPYSLRCAAQVHGAIYDAVEHLADKITIEINSVTDNPLIFVDDDLVLSGGNFHGESIAMALDYVGIALAEIANISERRLERLVNPQLSYGLPAFLVENGGVNSGFMIVQYTAAALVSENKVLAHPASVDSIPSSANQEDHVSMGAIAATKALKILKNSQNVVAFEYLASCQAIDLREGKKLGINTEKAYNKLRSKVPFINEDQIMHKMMYEAYKLIKEGKLCD